MAFPCSPEGDQVRCAAQLSQDAASSLHQPKLLLFVVRQDEEVEDESKLPAGRRWTRTSLKAFEDALISFGVGRLDNVLAQVSRPCLCSLVDWPLVIEVPRTDKAADPLAGAPYSCCNH